MVLEIAVDLESEDWEALRVLASSLLDARLADIVITAIDTPGYSEERVYRRKRKRDARRNISSCLVLEMCLSPVSDRGLVVTLWGIPADSRQYPQSPHLMHLKCGEVGGMTRVILGTIDDKQEARVGTSPLALFFFLSLLLHPHPLSLVLL